MFVHTLQKRTLTTGAVAVGLTAACCVLLGYPAAVSTGISRGLSICSAVIIPTLYPFMLLAGILADSPLCRRPGRAAEWIARRLFGLPGCCAPAILLSLVGGYPAGALAIARLYRQEQIDRAQVRRMTAFCVNGGPGFIISTVGAGLLGSVQAGMVLCAAQMAVSLGIGIYLGKGHRRQSETTTAPVLPPPRPAAQMVGDTCGALLTMCGFVVLAAALLSLSEAMGVARGIAAATGVAAGSVSALLAAILEVSCGCIALAGADGLTPLWLSLALSWGGLSVQGQLAAALPGERLLTPRFWIWRLVHGCCSGGVALILFHLFPPDRATVGGSPAPLPYSVSAAASLMLLFLSFLTMLCFSEKKAGKNEQGVVYWSKR